MNKNLPKIFIAILIDWYGKMKSKVKWGNSYSNWFEIKQGVRQGGILSPLLFSIYVDDVFEMLSKSKKGCFIGLTAYNVIMYTDDLMLLSISIADLQYVAELC